MKHANLSFENVGGGQLKSQVRDDVMRVSGADSTTSAPFTVVSVIVTETPSNCVRYVPVGKKWSGGDGGGEGEGGCGKGGGGGDVGGESEGGGGSAYCTFGETVDWPLALPPQHSASEVSFRMPQVWKPPAETIVLRQGSLTGVFDSKASTRTRAFTADANTWTGSH